MSGRTLLLTVMLFCYPPDNNAAAVASGRNWRISIDSIECEAAGSLIMIGTRVRYLGPAGAVEPPVSRLVDDAGKPYLPASLVWRSGAKELGELLSAVGLRSIDAGSLGEIQWKFRIPDAAGDLKLEFGDIRAFLVTRGRTRNSACEGLLRPDQVHGPRVPRRARVESAKLDFPVHRARYPCLPASTIEAEYPPYAPRQLLVFGRGYLPNAREVELPMGTVSAQPYSYAGLDDFIAVEKAARQAIVADFPQYSSSSRYFGFNWGTQRARSGNDMYSIGIYELRRCPK